MMDTRRSTPRYAYANGSFAEGPRTLPAEVAVALTFNGSTQAVMMATPGDLEDFALGFALTEGLAQPHDVVSLDIVDTGRGIDVQVWLHAPAEARLAARRRTNAGPVGCGLCGIDSLEQATRALPPVRAALRLTPSQVCAAVAALPLRQPLHDATRAAHAAALWTPACGIVLQREDVGRHNALDKLAGAMLRAGSARQGALLLTSRVSTDLVQKTAMLGVPVLIAVSAPTAQAVDLAEGCGITLIGLARADRFEVFSHPDRILPDEAADVA